MEKLYTTDNDDKSIDKKYENVCSLKGTKKNNFSGYFHFMFYLS